MRSERIGLKRPWKALLLFAGVLFFDQALKHFFYMTGEARINYGSLFGMDTFALFNGLAIFSFLVIVAWKLLHEKIIELLLPSTLVLAGVLSNTIDRLNYGFIIDYINASNFCAFNLADLAIFVGAFLFIWRITRK
jgi:lipoprotein signal peptidase